MMKKLKHLQIAFSGLSPYFGKYKWQFVLAIVFIIISKVSMVIAPAIEGMVTSQLFLDVQNAQGLSKIVISFDKITKTLVVLAGVYFMKTVAESIVVFYVTNAIQNTMCDLRNALQNKIRKLPVQYFDSHQFGDVLSRVTNDIDALSNAFQQTFVQIFGGIFTVVFTFIMMIRLNVVMTCIAFLIVPGMLTITTCIVKRSQKRFAAQQDALGNLNSAITEMYTGYHEIVLFNKQQDAIQKFTSLNEELRANAFKAQFISSIIQPLNSLVTYLVIGANALIGTIRVIEGSFDPGDLQAFIRYIWYVNDPLTQISSLSSQIQSAFAAMGRIVDILNEEEEIPEKDPAAKIEHTKGKVTFEHVRFGYHDELLMKDLNVTVESGQMVAIVGPTGAGKTTLINLLLRFYDVKGGSIKIDGIDIRDMKRGELRSMFGMVLQDTWLFHGTIYDNLRYGRLDARNDEIVEAAKMANVHHFIRTLPDGYHSYINEEGNNISQGEKQLLTIARAILKDPQILILDEATSSVDTRLEKMLQEAMKRIMKGRTSFVIAHRLSTIRNADLILVMNHGNIIEQGTHDELMAKKGAYEKLYNSQFANQE